MKQPRIAGSYNLISFKVFPLTTDRTSVAANPRNNGTFATGAVNARNDSFEIKSLVHTWSVTESIKSAAVRGTANVYDAVGAFYKIPLRGQEVLEITYRDTRDVELTEKFLIYAITDVKPSKSEDDGMLEYKLHFVSFGKFWSDRYEIQRCIANGSGVNRRYIPISNPEPNSQPGIVQVLFSDYYSNPGGTSKPFFASPTEGPAKIVIPSMRAEDAMHLMSRKAYNSVYEMQQFRFFENRFGYYFVSMEDWIQEGSKEYEPLEYTYSSGPGDNSPEGELLKMQNIISLDYGEFMNTVDMMESGAYHREYVGLNIFDKIPISSPYEYKTAFEDYTFPDEDLPMQLKHSDEFIDQHINKINTVYGLTDFGEIDNPARNYSEVYNNRIASMYHYKQNVIQASVYGSNELFAGSVISIVGLPRFGADNTENEGDRERNGKYIVESIQNNFIENSYIQTLTLTKGGLLDLESDQ